MPEFSRCGMSFLRFELRHGATVVVFRLAAPQLELDLHGNAVWVDETVFDRRSLEERLANLRRRGIAGQATAAVLAAWPRQAGTDQTADHALPSDTAAVTHGRRGDEGAEATADPQSPALPAGVLRGWQDCLRSAGEIRPDC
jgi:hypothetical protein